MNKCKICNTQFDGNTCPNCGNSIISEEKQMKRDKLSQIMAIISLALTVVSLFTTALIFIFDNMPSIIGFISLLSAITGLVFATISVIYAKEKKVLVFVH